LLAYYYSENGHRLSNNRTTLHHPFFICLSVPFNNERLRRLCKTIQAIAALTCRFSFLLLFRAGAELQQALNVAEPLRKTSGETKGHSEELYRSFSPLTVREISDSDLNKGATLKNSGTHGGA
jgi:hypothetical protein